MCGICGIVRPDGRPVDVAIVRRMMATLRHRGPDEGGVHAEPGVGLGFQRLSIIDLAGSHQPIGNEDGTLWAVCNGEIYNYLQLRETLAAAGHRFSTQGDIETVVHAYEEWGDDFVLHLRGMFAVAIWDRRRQELVLARDRFGIKPLYYAEVSGGLLFGSELKAVLAADQAGREIDWEAIDLYLTLMYIPSPRTAYRAVRKLPPATLLRWGRNGIVQQRYWRPPEPEAVAAPREAAERLLAALRESVRLHLQSDVPVGFFLSGGLDSSALVALAAERGPGVKTFTVGFEARSHSELEYARIVARAFGCEHHETIVNPDAAGCLPRIVSQFDEPFGDSSALPTYHVCQAAAGQVKVVVGGDGGDELFAGYDWTRRQRFVERWQRVPAGLRELARGALAGVRDRRGTMGKLARFTDDAHRTPLAGYLRRMSCLTAEMKQRLYAGPLREQAGREPAAHLMEPFFAQGATDPVTAMNRADLGLYLPDDDLCKVDRLTMLFSLEGRVPLLDNAVADVAFSLPMSLKLRGATTKFIFKQAVGRLLPAAIRRQRKQGFAIPVAAWMRGELHAPTRRVLLSRRARERGILAPEAVEALLQAHLSGTRDCGHALWVLLVLELWFRLHIDADGAGAGAATLAELA